MFIRSTFSAVTAAGLLCAGWFFVGSATNGTHLWAANKVPTTRIIVPEESDETETEPAISVPVEELPDPNVTGPASTDLPKDDAEEDLADEPSTPKTSGPPPEIMRDLSKLPAAVRQTRQNILDAAKTGDINNLRRLIGIGANQTELSLSGFDGDPIDYLKNASGDAAGHEVLAILTEILEAGYVHTGKGTDDEMYLWPYFFAWPLDKLTPPMRVELFRILTAGDLEDAASFGGYIFYRAGIRPDGTWSFFVAGD